MTSRQRGLPPQMTTTKRQGRLHRRGKLRRRLSGALALGLALLGAGVLYTVAAPRQQTAVAQENPAQLREGEQLYNNHCISCHGANLQGVPDRGPSLIGVGEAAAYFQVSSGRMPMARQEAQAERKPVQFTPEEIDAISAFVGANGGGPTRPEEAGEALRGDDSARGGELFRLNCASCHNFTGRGGALSSGKFAPELDQATEEQMYTAMLTGPQNMPVFGDNQLTPDEKRDVIAYIEHLQSDPDPGGWGIGRLGPVPEGLAVFLIGMVALVFTTLWIAGKS
jgi:ubiquinol-cytochrome c reductase cytochrome c subunit